MQLHLAATILFFCAIAYIGFHFLTRNNKKEEPKRKPTPPSSSLAESTEFEIVYQISQYLTRLHDEYHAAGKSISVISIEGKLSRLLNHLRNVPELGPFQNPRITHRVVDGRRIKFLIVGARFGTRTEVEFPYGRNII